MNTTAKSSKSTSWMLFLVSLIATVALLVFLPEWFWVGLPFVLTFMCEGLDYL